MDFATASRQTENEILSYIGKELRVVTDDCVQVRKLVRKDREISSYSFVSFKITCPAAMFETLLDASKWPSNCMIREFEMETIESTGTKLAKNSPTVESAPHKTKNDQNQPPESMPNSLQVEASQVTL